MIFTATSDGLLQIAGRAVRCALGRGGVRPAVDKREGDGATPAGLWPVRRLLYRPDRGGQPGALLPATAIAPDDGWCDAPDDPAYNRPVKLPYRASAEALWRDDEIYDLVVVLGHNDNPVRTGRGSAIFLHLARPGYPPTEGCVALARNDMVELLRLAQPGDMLAVA